VGAKDLLMADKHASIRINKENPPENKDHIHVNILGPCFICMIQQPGSQFKLYSGRFTIWDPFFDWLPGTNAKGSVINLPERARCCLYRSKVYPPCPFLCLTVPLLAIS